MPAHPALGRGHRPRAALASKAQSEDDWELKHALERRASSGFCPGHKPPTSVLEPLGSLWVMGCVQILHSVFSFLLINMSLALLWVPQIPVSPPWGSPRCPSWASVLHWSGPSAHLDSTEAPCLPQAAVYPGFS